MRRTKPFIAQAMLLLTVSALIGCEPEQSATETHETPAAATTAATTAAITLPDDLFVDKAPAGARSVGEVKADETATGDVVIQGRIAGRKEPFVEGAAMFLLADTSMPSCTELHGDTCKTPWDLCCEPRDSLTAKTATIQVVDGEGKPLRADLKEKHGLTQLARVTVSGTIAQRDAGSLVINATKIHVEPSEG